MLKVGRKLFCFSQSENESESIVTKQAYPEAFSKDL
jgi:hypothetical protein